MAVTVFMVVVVVALLMTLDFRTERVFQSIVLDAAVHARFLHKDDAYACCHRTRDSTDK